MKYIIPDLEEVEALPEYVKDLVFEDTEEYTFKRISLTKIKKDVISKYLDGKNIQK